MDTNNDDIRRCGEYVSSIGLNLELCKLAICTLCKKEGVAQSYTLEEVVKFNKSEIGHVKVFASYDIWFLSKRQVMYHIHQMH